LCFLPAHLAALLRLTVLKANQQHPPNNDC
jgi:hypothetical protein